MIVVVMGVSGVGKTTVGMKLAERLGWPFLEGDDLHPEANVTKMGAGIPLTDADRAPWLDALARRFEDWRAVGRDGVVACSALRRAYRDRLAEGREDVRFICLRAPRDQVLQRMSKRHGHFMPPALLDSQLDALELPSESERGRAVVLDATQTPDAIVEEAVAWLSTT